MTDKLREALVVWLADTYESAYQYATVEPDFDWDVDALLALPAVAELRAKADAADRVRELADDLEATPTTGNDGIRLGRVVYRIRAALDGDQS